MLGDKGGRNGFFEMESGAVESHSRLVSEAERFSSGKQDWYTEHPDILTFHFLFRSLALFVYIFSSILGMSFVTSCVFITIFLSFDFWTVKNVCGRILVGLRWWNETKEDGSSEWMFENNAGAGHINEYDRRIFWNSLYAYSAAWVFLLFVSIIQLNIMWASMCLVGIIFNLSNLIGYIKCDKDAKKQLVDGVGKSFITNMFK